MDNPGWCTRVCGRVIKRVSVGGHSPKKKKKLEADILVAKRKAGRCLFVKKGDPMFSTPWDPTFFIEPRTPYPTLSTVKQPSKLQPF